MTTREVIIGMLGLALSMLTALLGLAYRYGQVVNEVKSLAKSIDKTGRAIDRHIAWHMRRSRDNDG